MGIRVDQHRVKLERERRAWSQEHLAKVTGLGLRTVQRIEKTGSASAESLRSLASAFSLELDALRTDEIQPSRRALRGLGVNAPTALASSFGVFVGAAIYSLLTVGIEQLEWARALLAGLFASFFWLAVLAGAPFARSQRETRTSKN